MQRHDVLIVEDDAVLRDALCDTLRARKLSVCAAADGREALALLDRSEVGLLLSDVQMEPMGGRELLTEVRRLHPELPAVLMTAFGTIEQAVDAMRDGACDYLVKPIDADNLIETLRRHLRRQVAHGEPVAEDPSSIELLELTRRVARSEATVMISGESGCGKEVVARYLHEHSPRKNKPFVAINCAAIPENMLEAVLFGHEKGAFTGASAAYPGKFEQAQDGTLLLDEVSEMQIGLQAKLLRVIQEREVERIGGRKTIPLNVRVLATTNRDLRQCVADGGFREDLYYRLSVFPLHIAPLRERPADILPLADFAIARHLEAARAVPTLSEDAQAKLLAHDWPGNVRELDNLIQRTLILQPGDLIADSDLVFEPAAASRRGEDSERAAAKTDTQNDLQDSLRHRERQVILDVLARCGGNRTAAAKTLGISARTLRYKMARLRENGVALPANATRASA